MVRWCTARRSPSSEGHLVSARHAHSPSGFTEVDHGVVCRRLDIVPDQARGIFRLAIRDGTRNRNALQTKFSVSSLPLACHLLGGLHEIFTEGCTLHPDTRCEYASVCADAGRRAAPAQAPAGTSGRGRAARGAEGKYDVLGKTRPHGPGMAYPLPSKLGNKNKRPAEFKLS